MNELIVIKNEIEIYVTRPECNVHRRVRKAWFTKFEVSSNRELD